MNSPTLLNVPRSEKAASLRKRRKDELEKYRRGMPECVTGPKPKEDEFSLPDEDRLLTEIHNGTCRQMYNFAAGTFRCNAVLALERRGGMYSIVCPTCRHWYVLPQSTSQKAMAAWRVYRAMCK